MQRYNFCDTRSINAWILLYGDEQSRFNYSWNGEMIYTIYSEIIYFSLPRREEKKYVKNRYVINPIEWIKFKFNLVKYIIQIFNSC